MRTFTEKDKKGTLAALRVLARTASGERLNSKTGMALVEKALSSGLTLDVLLNKENYGRATAVVENPRMEDYIEALNERTIEARGIKEENAWRREEGGFMLVAEEFHDFFMEVTGRGGTWTTANALRNLAIVIDRYSLQAIMSSELIGRIESELGERMTSFNYIEKLANDLDTGVDTSLSEEQEGRVKEDEEYFNTLMEETGERTDNQNEEDNAPVRNDDSEKAGSATTGDAEQDEYWDDDDQDLIDADGYGLQETGSGGFQTMIGIKDTPAETKRKCLYATLVSYTRADLEPLIDLVDEDRQLTLAEIVDELVAGRFDPSKEGTTAKKTHESINIELIPGFVDCVTFQKIAMDDKTAMEYDLLKDNWDLRDPETRKLQKLKNLVILHGDEDSDLLEAIKDMENLYTKRETDN